MKNKVQQMALALAVLAGTTLAFDVKGDTISGDELMKLCEGDPADQAACDMYIYGVLDGLYQGTKHLSDVTPGLTLEEAIGYCEPKGITMG